MTGRPARCDVCGDVVDSLHPWDVRTCACGRLTVSGGPKHRRVLWRAEPGAGWTDLAGEPEDGADEEAHDDEADHDEAGDHEPDDTADDGAVSAPAGSSSAGAGSSWLTPSGGDGPLDLAPVDGLPLQEQLDDPVERGPVLGQQPRRPLLRLSQ